MSLSITPLLVSSKSISSTAPLFLSTSTSTSNPSFLAVPRKTTVIRMGGGPRTFPGGVSKWEWKRMQAKKAKQLLKVRLSRERQIYEMRKRAELKAAVSELERPWEVVERAPNLFSVDVDEQLKVLADRFQRPGGFDLWSEQDGPEIFKKHDVIPSGRFFPKGVVHSIKPYGKVRTYGLERVEDSVCGRSDGTVRRTGGMRNSRDFEHGGSKGDWRISRSRVLHNSNDSGGGFYDMSLQTDGRYEFLEKNEH